MPKRPDILIETALEINQHDLEAVERVGVTAGASTPNWLIEQVVERLRAIGERARTGTGRMS